MQMAAKFGMNLTPAQAKLINRNFRTGRPKLIKMWASFNDAAMKAVSEGTRAWVEGTDRTIAFIREGNFLYMELPSKRLLSFPYPEIRDELFFGRMIKNVTAMWVDSGPKGNNKWTRRSLTGANFFQSAVQASCRDILFDGHLLVEEQGYPLILSVHDEGLSLVPKDGAYSIKKYEKMMTVAQGWYKDFPLESDCWSGPRYKK